MGEANNFSHSLNMELKNIYWVAALIDGEGCFSFASTPQIQLTSTDLDTVQTYARITKATSSIRVTNKYPHKTIYNLNLNGKHAVQWMMTIYSIMSRRRKDRIKEILAMWKAMSRGNGITCKLGHYLSGRNLILEYINTGVSRRCRICRNVEQQAGRLRRAKLNV